MAYYFQATRWCTSNEPPERALKNPGMKTAAETSATAHNVASLCAAA